MKAHDRAGDWLIVLGVAMLIALCVWLMVQQRQCAALCGSRGYLYQDGCDDTATCTCGPAADGGTVSR